MAKKTKEVFSYKTEAARLKESGPERLYFLYGEEDYLRQLYFELLVKTCLEGGEADFNHKRLSGENLNMNRLAEAVDTVPFFSEHTVVEVKDYDINRCKDAELERLKTIISDIPDYCTLIFIQSSDYSPDGRLASVKALQKYGRVVECNQQGQKDLCDWIGKRFAANGKRISREDAERLIFLGGSYMNRLIPEIEKLSTGVKGEVISAADIELMVQRLPEADIFEMTDLIGAGNFDAAARMLSELLGKKEEPIKILALIGMQMRRVYAMKLGLSRGMRGPELMELTGVKFDFLLQKLRRSAERFELDRLKDIVEQCAVYDHKMKSSGGDSAQLLKELFARMAAGVKC